MVQNPGLYFCFLRLISVLQLSFSFWYPVNCHLTSLTSLRSSNLSRFQQLISLDESLHSPTIKEVLSCACVSQQGLLMFPITNQWPLLQKSDHYIQYKRSNINVSFASDPKLLIDSRYLSEHHNSYFHHLFEFLSGIQWSPLWPSDLQPHLHLISNNVQRLQTVGRDPWVWPLVRVSGRWRSESPPSLATASSTACQHCLNLGCWIRLSSKQQSNDLPAAYIRFLVYLGGRFDVLLLVS